MRHEVQEKKRSTYEDFCDTCITTVEIIVIIDLVGTYVRYVYQVSLNTADLLLAENYQVYVSTVRISKNVPVSTDIGLIIDAQVVLY